MRMSFDMANKRIRTIKKNNNYSSVFFDLTKYGDEIPDFHTSKYVLSPIQINSLSAPTLQYIIQNIVISVGYYNIMLISIYDIWIDTEYHIDFAVKVIL